MKQTAKMGLLPLILLVLVGLTGCASLRKSMNRDEDIHKRVSSLELGMSVSTVRQYIDHEPNSLSREINNGSKRDVLVYFGRYSPGWGHGYTPMIYTLFFENDQLVAIDIEEDWQRIRMEERRRIEQERAEAEERRTQALIEAQKAEREKEKKKKEEQN